MASVPGRGAQVRLDGELQRIARGGGALRLTDNLLRQRILERSGAYADGESPDGSTPNGQAAKDEVLTPGGAVPAGGGVDLGTAVEVSSVAVMLDGSNAMKAPLPIDAAPVAPNHAARKQELDASTSLQRASGAPARPLVSRARFQLFADDFLSDTDLLSVRAGTMDVDITDRLQNAHAEAASEKVRLIYGAGIYPHRGGLTIYPGLNISGQGNGGTRAPTILRLLPGSNADVLTGLNAHAMFGTTNSNLDAQATGSGVSDLVLDGNRIAQTLVNGDLQNGISIYGSAWRLTNVDIMNVRGHGLRSEWGQHGETPGGLEAALKNVKIDITGRHGWLNNGPHDIDADHVIIIDASQEADDTYCGMYSGGYANGRYRNMHVWHRGAATNRARYALDSGGASMYTDCYFEGTRRLARHRGGDMMKGCRMDACRGDNGTPLVTIAGDNVSYTGGSRIIGNPSLDQLAVQIGEEGKYVGAYRLECIIANFNSRPPINFVSDYAGYIDIEGVQGVELPTLFTGAKHVNTTLRMRVSDVQVHELGIASLDITRREETPTYRGRRHRGTAAAPENINDREALVRLRGEGRVGGAFKNLGEVYIRGRNPETNPYGEFVVQLANIETGEIQEAFVASATTLTPSGHNTKNFGRFETRWANAYLTRLFVGESGNVQVRVGDGDPDGAVTAAPGSLYLRRDGAQGTALYVKESKTDAFGWVPASSAASVVEGATDITTARLTTSAEDASTTLALTASGDVVRRRAEDEPYTAASTKLRRVEVQAGPDFTARLQSAFDVALASGGVSVFIGAGTHSQTAGHIIYRNTAVEMHPSAVIVRDHNASMFVNGETGATYPGYSGHGNIIWRNGTLDMNVANRPLPANSFGLARGEKLRFYDLTVKDVPADHAFDLNACRDVLFQGARFLGFKDTTSDASRGFSEAIQVSQHTALGFTRFGPFDGTACQDVRVVGCYFGASGTAGTQAWPVGVGNHGAVADQITTNVEVSSCVFDGMTLVGVRPFAWDGVRIIGNQFSDCYRDVVLTNITGGTESSKNGAGVQTNAVIGNKNIQIRQNTFRGTLNNAIYGAMIPYQTTTGWMENIQIEDNHFAPAAGNTATAVQLLWAKGAIRRNRFDGAYRCHWLEFFDGIEMDGQCYDTANEFVYTPENNVSFAGQGLTKGLRTGAVKAVRNGKSVFNIQAVQGFELGGAEIIEPCRDEDNVRPAINISLGAKQGVVRRQKIRSATTGGRPNYGVQVSAACTDVQVEGGDIDAATADILISGTTNWSGELSQSGTSGMRRRVDLGNGIFVATKRIRTAAAQAVVDAMQAVASPSWAYCELVSWAVDEMISVGIWGTRDAFYCTMCSEAEIARINWRNPGVANLTLVNSPVFTPQRGFRGDGTAAYIGTGLIPNALTYALQDTASYGVYVSDSAGSETAPVVGVETGAYIYMLPVSTAGQYGTRANTTEAIASVAVPDGLGLSSVIRRNATAYQRWRNGVPFADVTAASAAPPAAQITLLRTGASYSSTQTVGGFHAGGAINSRQERRLVEIFDTIRKARNG